MSKFTGPLKVSFSEARYAVLWEDLVWEVGHEGSGVEIRIPAGFHSDGMSVPRILWALMPAWGDTGTRAAILHDWLLELAEPLQKDDLPLYRKKRAEADRQFYEALIALGVEKWRARLCYLGVRAYGIYWGRIGIYLAGLLG